MSAARFCPSALGDTLLVNPSESKGRFLTPCRKSDESDPGRRATLITSETLHCRCIPKPTNFVQSDGCCLRRPTHTLRWERLVATLARGPHAVSVGEVEAIIILQRTWPHSPSTYVNSEWSRREGGRGEGPQNRVKCVLNKTTATAPECVFPLCRALRRPSTPSPFAIVGPATSSTSMLVSTSSPCP